MKAVSDDSVAHLRKQISMPQTCNSYLAKYRSPSTPSLQTSSAHTNVHYVAFYPESSVWAVVARKVQAAVRYRLAVVTVVALPPTSPGPPCHLLIGCDVPPPLFPALRELGQQLHRATDKSRALVDVQKDTIGPNARGDSQRPGRRSRFRPSIAAGGLDVTSLLSWRGSAPGTARARVEGFSRQVRVRSLRPPDGARALS